MRETQQRSRVYPIRVVKRFRGSALGMVAPFLV